MKALLIIFTSLLQLNFALANDQWSQFRGPFGNGHILKTSSPISWNETKNVLWKTPIHDRGWSSPVIWNDQVWMTTATKKGHKMFAVCVHKETGKVIVAVDKNYFRPSEVETLLGDATKAKKNLNWQPKISLEDLVNEMMEHDLKNAQEELLLRSHKKES